MEEISYSKLHEQYKGEHSPSPEAQIAWLQKKGFDFEDIKSAMMHVYGELARGEKEFTDAKVTDEMGNERLYHAGTQLDHYLLAVAKTYKEARLANSVAFIEKNHNYLIGKSLGRLGFWGRVRALFTGRVA